MSFRPAQNFRGRSALLLMADDRNAMALRDTLNKLGLNTTRICLTSPEIETAAAIATADVLVADADTLEPPVQTLLMEARAPIIALIGHESPSRLLRAFDVRPASVLMKPVGRSGVFTALYFAFNEHLRRRLTEDELSEALDRLSARRIIVKAILQLVQERGINDDEAYRYLRKESMRRRITVEDLSAQLVACGPIRQGSKNAGA